MRREVCLAMAGLGLGLGSACERPGSAPGSSPPGRVPVGSDAAMLDVPYPIGEPERIEGAGRRALVDARFAFVSRGGIDETGLHALPERVASEGPLLIAHHVLADQRAWVELRRLAFGRVDAPAGQAVEVDEAELVELSLVRPADALWLVGPRGTCRARVTTPVVSAIEGLDALVVAYRLEDCPGHAWAQIGIIADAIPVDFRWVPARSAEELVVPYGELDESIAPVLPAPAWSSPEPPRFELLQMREVPDAEPRVIQAHRSWLSAVPEEGSSTWCQVEAASTRLDGWFNGRWLDAIPWVPDAEGPYMLGAFVNGTQVDAVIYDDRFDGLVVVPPGPLDDVDDAKAWTQTFVPTGPYRESELGAWGIRPERGMRPLGARCEPQASAVTDPS